MMQARTLATGLPLIYAHLVGGQDEIVFEGRSFALQADGSLAGRAESFKENLFVAQAERGQMLLN
jgi:NAD+ synthase (glutamine-hydrolysing)